MKKELGGCLMPLSLIILLASFVMFLLCLVSKDVQSIGKNIKDWYEKPDTTIVIKNGKADTIITLKKL